MMAAAIEIWVLNNEVNKLSFVSHFTIRWLNMLPDRLFPFWLAVWQDALAQRHKFDILVERNVSLTGFPEW